jgi:hypothetical protein
MGVMRVGLIREIVDGRSVEVQASRGIICLGLSVRRVARQRACLSRSIG